MSGTPSDIKLIDENGIRIDGRKVDEMRPLKIEAGVLKRADGSAYLEWGKNKVIAAVYGPRECHPRHMQNRAKAIVQCKYNMMSFSGSDRKRPGRDRRVHRGSPRSSPRRSKKRRLHRELSPGPDRCLTFEVLAGQCRHQGAGLTAASVALADAASQ